MGWFFYITLFILTPHHHMSLIGDVNCRKIQLAQSILHPHQVSLARGQHCITHKRRVFFKRRVLWSVISCYQCSLSSADESQTEQTSIRGWALTASTSQALTISAVFWRYFSRDLIKGVVTLKISTCLFLSGFLDFHSHRKPDTNLEKINISYSLHPPMSHIVPHRKRNFATSRSTSCLVISRMLVFSSGVSLWKAGWISKGAQRH